MNSTRVIKFLTLTLISGALLAIPRPPDLGIGSYILYEPSTKKIIVSFNENESVEPASLTKLMTSYVVADYLKDEFIKEGELQGQVTEMTSDEISNIKQKILAQN